MDRMSKALCVMLLPGVIMLLLAGCAATDPGVYPMLGTIRPVDAAGVHGDRNIVIAVGPIDVPAYIDRAVTIVETTPNPANISSVDQKAYALKREIPRVLTEDLKALLAPDGISVVMYTHGTQSDYRVRIDLAVFDVARSDILETKASWALYKKGGEPPVMFRDISFETPVEQRDEAGARAAMSKALAEMSRSIARAIKPVLEGK